MVDIFCIDYFLNLKRMEISVCSPLGSIIPATVSQDSSPATIYSALFGSNLNPLEFSVVLNGIIISPYAPLSKQGITEESIIKFAPNHAASVDSFRTSIANHEEEHTGFGLVRSGSEPIKRPLPIIPIEELNKLRQCFSAEVSEDEDQELDLDDDESENEMDDEEEREEKNQELIKSIENEAARIKELRLTRLDMSRSGGMVYQQIAKSLEESSNSTVIDDMVYSEEGCDNPPKTLSRDPLPCFWEVNPDDAQYQQYLLSIPESKYSSIEEAGKDLCNEEMHWQW